MRRSQKVKEENRVTASHTAFGVTHAATEAHDSLQIYYRHETLYEASSWIYPTPPPPLFPSSLRNALHTRKELLFMRICRHHTVGRQCADPFVTPECAVSVCRSVCVHFLGFLASRATSILAPHPNTLRSPTWQLPNRGNDVGGQRKMQTANAHLSVAFRPASPDVSSIGLPSHRSCLRPPPHLLLSAVVEESHALHYGSRRRKRSSHSTNTTAGTRRRTPRLDYPPAEASRITCHAGTQTPLFRAPGPAAAPSTPSGHPTLVLRLLYHTAMTRPPPHHPTGTLHNLRKKKDHALHIPSSSYTRSSSSYTPCPFSPGRANLHIAVPNFGFRKTNADGVIPGHQRR
ncbi:hypothetical protein R3P38DRAFT_3290573 [Favolaschia claudopus]|uniref:Uncharacterized protein n=1 Tax=Favolaschia claudopus TaxID=2862362 RepID=A0AAV9ZSZ4_9AGAR